MSETTEHLLDAVHGEAVDLSLKHGLMPRTVEAAYFHTTRAYRSLDEALLAKQPDHVRQRDRLVHLAAVCIRAAEALSVHTQEGAE